MKLFRAMTTLLMVALLLSAFLHIVLLMSDSPEYRRWVYVQISLQVIGAWLLWQAHKFRLLALIGFLAVSLPLVYINATHINYGRGASLWQVPLILLCLYAALAFYARQGFGSLGRPSGA